MRAFNEKFAPLGTPRRVWVVAAVRGDRDRLVALHDHLATRFSPRDRLVYLGNYLGASSACNAEILEELLAFRAALMARPGMEPEDIVYLRGPAEEAWLRLLRLQFAPVPGQALETLLQSGADAWLRLYGVSLADARSMGRASSVVITRWTNQLRALQRASAGHEALICAMRRAAFTSPPERGARGLLFVPAGFDDSRSLDDQGDRLWYGTSGFPDSGLVSSPYARIVRGCDAERGGIRTEGLGVTLDGGCGQGGPLACGCFYPSGRLVEIVAVGGQGAIESLAFDDRRRDPASRVVPPPHFVESVLAIRA